jgi:YidC/Oxa1 family membrane protein insertase
MEKKYLLAFLLSLGVLVLTQLYIEKRVKPAQTTTPATQAAESTGHPTPAPVPPVPAVRRHSLPQESAEVTAAGEHDIVLENSRVRILLTNRGAVIKSWLLKGFRDSDRKPLDVLAGLDPQKDQAVLPLRLDFPSDPALDGAIDAALFVDSREDFKSEGMSVILRYASGGVSVQKTLSLSKDSYIAQLQIDVKKDETELPFRVAWPSKFGDNALDIRTNLRQIVTAIPGKIDHSSLAKVKGSPELSGGFRFGGIEDRYFAAVFLADALIPRIQYTADGAHFLLPPVPVHLFVGPKEIGLLRRVDPQLESLIDFGWFGIIGKPLFMALKWIYGYCSNYGVAIILLTLVINMALFPLRWKSMMSAQKMQKIQPRIKAIQERYKKYKVNDPKRQEMNQEMMGLYKEHGVNPLGGCLPLLLQMPILVAFYNVLNNAIDLRQVSFLWIPDLSQYDKTFVLVIIMVVTQFVMQKLTPSPSADPAQAKMFMIMPLVFGFMFAKVASGLVLYWLTGNVIGIVQQVFLNRLGVAQPATTRKDLKGK